jgi:hypothetical protein
MAVLISVRLWCLWVKAGEGPSDTIREVQGEMGKLQEEIDKLGRRIQAAEEFGDREMELVLRQEMALLRRKEIILLERSLAGQGV